MRSGTWQSDGGLSLGLHHILATNLGSAFSSVTDPQMSIHNKELWLQKVCRLNPLPSGLISVSGNKEVKGIDYGVAGTRVLLYTLTHTNTHTQCWFIVTPWWSHTPSAVTHGWENSTSLTHLQRPIKTLFLSQRASACYFSLPQLYVGQQNMCCIFLTFNISHKILKTR